MIALAAGDLTMKGKGPFERPRRLEQFYRAQIDALMDKYFVMPTFQTLGEINSRMVEWGQAVGFFQAVAETLAKRMVTMVATTNAKSWRAAATKASSGRIIYPLLQESLRGATGLHVNQLIQQNAGYITSLPQSIAEMVTRHVQAQQMKGIRSEEIVKQLRPYMKRAKDYQIERLARTEVAKADTAITRARAQSIGVNWYQWVTSEDARVRKSHRKMDQVLINWSDAPSPESLAGERTEGHYHAGNIYNCRCVALPLISLSEIQFPARVYVGGSIKRLTQKQFQLISGSRLIAA
jgi:SPP1 gp7 family putative phage head morphogenesis protein